MASLESAAVESLDREELRKCCNSNSSDASLWGTPVTPTIRVTVVQSGRRSKFNIVERTTWKGGVWHEHDSTRHNLTMIGTDVSGILRFKSEDSKPEFFLVALGVDKPEKFKHRIEHPRIGPPPIEHPHRWCDLKINASPDDVAVLLHPKYYTQGTEEYNAKKRHHGKLHHRTEAGTHITVDYYFAERVKKRWVFDERVKDPRVFDEGVTEPQDFDEDVNEPGVFDEDVKEPGVFHEGIIDPWGIDVVRLRAVKITIT